MWRVLLVEDDPDVAASTKATLEHLGYFVILASDGHQGFELIASEQPDIVVTDEMMPVMSGFEMVERAREAHYKGFVVVCSAISESGVRNRQARYDAFLQKPYRVQDIASILNMLRAISDGAK
ncbi:response regulator [Dyella monticola]|uniref:Response regulator n=1 Tax=Dyella monticola TaxID=1927958 RepID=A0A370X5D4_9GAMM|nr:response regulator [Dyella monticola]RDS83576.1 response regulator [Dyella monticola]